MVPIKRGTARRLGLATPKRREYFFLGDPWSFPASGNDGGVWATAEELAAMQRPVSFSLRVRQH